MQWLKIDWLSKPHRLCWVSWRANHIDWSQTNTGSDWDDDRTVICNLLSVSTVCACVGERQRVLVRLHQPPKLQNADGPRSAGTWAITSTRKTTRLEIWNTFTGGQVRSSDPDKQERHPKRIQFLLQRRQRDVDGHVCQGVYVYLCFQMWV